MATNEVQAEPIMEETKLINKICRHLRVRGLDGDKYAITTPFDLPVVRGHKLATEFNYLCLGMSHENFLPCENVFIEEVQSNGYRNFVCSLIYLERFMESNYVVSSRNITMLMYVAFMLVDKYNDDMSFENSELAQVLGLNIKQLNKCEILFLTSINFNLRISNEQYIHYTNILNKFIH